MDMSVRALKLLNKFQNIKLNVISNWKVCRKFKFEQHGRFTGTGSYPVISRFRSYCTNTQESTPNTEHFDIVIAGGGMVGFAAAVSIGRNVRLQDKNILLLESQPKKSWKLPTEYSNRVSALSSHTYNLFNNCQVWKHLDRTQQVKKMMIWESLSEAMISFDEKDLNNEGPVAHIVENDVILNAFKFQIPENVTVDYNVKITNYTLPANSEEFVYISTGDGRSISTDLLIGADGAKSQVRKSMKSHYLSWEYDQMGIVATLHLSEEQDNNIAWQKFLSTGPVSMLPLSSTQSSLVWSTTKKQAKQLLSLNENDFVDALNNALWQDGRVDSTVRSIHERWQAMLRTAFPSSGTRHLPPSISGAKARAGFPLGLGHAAHYVAPRVALIGDAAHRVHPLAGQGVNLGFGDVASLTSCLENCILQGAQIGDVGHLYKYESDRQAHNLASMTAIDGLYRLYSTSCKPLVLLRSLGLSAVDAIQPIKRKIMSHAES